MSKYYYTPNEYKELLKHLCVIGTTNEQVNNHITEWFAEKDIKFKARKLATGDYCFRINACPELGYLTDTYYTDELFIERKNSLTELASSINNEAFHYELKRAQSKKHKFLLVEQPNGWQGLLAHDYITRYSEKAFWTTLHTLEIKYGLHIKFIDKKYMGLEIYSICKSVLDGEVLK